MEIFDYSPNHENTTGLPDKMAFSAGSTLIYNSIVNYCKYAFNAIWINNLELTRGQAKRYLPKNSKVYVTCVWNDILGKYEIGITNKKGTKPLDYWRFDYVGRLTDFFDYIKKEG